MRINNPRLVENLLRDPRQRLQISLTPSDEDDVWNLYNLIHPGDRVAAITTRKVKIQTGSGDGGVSKSSASQRETLVLTIKVVKSEFDPAVNELRLSGTVESESDAVGLGQGHSLTIKSETSLKLDKGDDGWDSVDLELLRDSLTGEKHEAVPAIMMQQGKAYLVMIRTNRTVVLASIESSNIRVKGLGDSKNVDAATTKHHEKILTAIREHLDIQHRDVGKLMLIGPGYWAQAFHTYLSRQAMLTGDTALKTLAAQANVISFPVGLSHGLQYIIEDPTVRANLKGMRFSSDADAMERFTKIIKKDEHRAWYGLGPVGRALEFGAISGGAELLVLDSLFRLKDLEERKKYVALVDKAKEAKAKVTIIGSENPAGTQLKLLSGVAAILSFPMEDLDEEAPVQWDDEDQDYIV